MPATSDMKFMRLQQVLQVIVLLRSAAEEEKIKEVDAAAAIYSKAKGSDKCDWEEVEG